MILQVDPTLRGAHFKDASGTEWVFFLWLNEKDQLALAGMASSNFPAQLYAVVVDSWL